MRIVPTTSEDFSNFKYVLSKLYKDIIFKKVVSVHCKEWDWDKGEYAKYTDETISPQKIINSTAIRCYIFKKGRTDHFGHFDIRPFKLENVKNDVVCDAFLPDPHRLGSEKDEIFITCKKSYRADDFGHSVIKTVPYTLADGVLAYCTHATLWIIFRLFSYEFGKEYISLVDLATDLYRDEEGSVGTNTIPRVCEKYGYNYFLYDGKGKTEHYKKADDAITKIKDKKCVSDEEIDTLKQVVDEHRSVFSSPKDALLTSNSLYAYVESEIPVYLLFDAEDLQSEYGFGGTGTHSIVAIGHTMKNGELADFIVHDVSFAPFVKISRKLVDEKLIDSIVILPSEIKIRYELARRRIIEWLLQFYETGLFHESNKILSKDELVKRRKDVIDKYFFRAFLMKSQRLKFWYTMNDYPEYFRDMIARADFPKYIWTFEIKTREIPNNKCMGHIIIDATSDKNGNTESAVLVNMPNYKMYYQNGERKTLPPQQENEFPLFRAMS